MNDSNIFFELFWEEFRLFLTKIGDLQKYYLTSNFFATTLNKYIFILTKKKRKKEKHICKHICKKTQRKEKSNFTTPSRTQDVCEIFTYWQHVMRHPGARLDSPRRYKIQQALQHYSVADLKQAIDGCANSDYHMGRQGGQPKVYDNLTLILRDADHIERFMALTKPVAVNPDDLLAEWQQQAELQ